MVVDRLAVAFTVSGATQAWRVREKLGSNASFVQGLDADGIDFAHDKVNTPTTRFRATFQNPHSAQAVLDALQVCAPVSPPMLVMLEAALDIYVKGADKRTLSQIVVDLYRFVEVQPNSHWHIYRKKGEGALSIDSDTNLVNRSLVRQLAEDWQLADTPDKSASRRFHGYVKTYDHDSDSGKVTSLPATQWRARLEVTLQGSEIPTDDAGTLDTLSVAKLINHFRFRKFAGNLHPAARHALETVSLRQHGREGSYLRKHPMKVGVHSGQRTKYRTSTQANGAMNEAVRMALRRLDRGWRSMNSTARRKTADKNSRSDLRSPPRDQLNPQEPAMPVGRVLWEYGGPGRKRWASNYRQQLSPQLALHSDGTTTIEFQMQDQDA